MDKSVKIFRTPVPILLFCCLSIFYLFTRFYHLALFPIFTDESIYLRIAQVLTDDPGEINLFRMEGKHPLYIWLCVLAFQVVDDPLLAGRAVSVISGLASLVGIYHLTRLCYPPATAWMAALLYLICPFPYFFERLAMVDSLLNALGIWLIYLSVRMAHGDYRGGGLLPGTVAGLAFYTKFTALIYFLPALVAPYFFKDEKKVNFKVFYVYPILIFGFFVLILYGLGKEIGYFHPAKPLRLPLLFLTGEQWAAFPLDIWIGNGKIVLSFLLVYFPTPIIILSVYAIWYSILKKDKKSLFFVFWAGFPTILIILITSGFFSRYFIFLIAPIIILAARSACLLLEFMQNRIKEANNPKGIFLKQQLLSAFFVVLLTIDGMDFIKKMGTNPVKAPVHELDRMLYLSGNNSGYGVREAAEFLKKQATKSNLLVFVPQKPGNPPEGMEVFLWKNPAITIVPILEWKNISKRLAGDKNSLWPRSRYHKTRKQLLKIDKNTNIYFLYPYTTYPESRFLQANSGFEKVWTYSHLNALDTINIFKLRS